MEESSQPSSVYVMDSYYISHKKEHYIFSTFLELPFHIQNQPLGIDVLKFNSGNFEKVELRTSPKGIHIRNIFDLELSDKHYIYFVDHGLDIDPFPGGHVHRLEFTSGEITTFHEFDGKFNFSGSAFYWNETLYELFVGINYSPRLYINGKAYDEFTQKIDSFRTAQGYLTSLIFEKNEQLYFFLGLTDTDPSCELPSIDGDLLVVYDGQDFNFHLLERNVPADWATVFSCKTSYLGKEIILVSHHNNGFTEFEFGYYEINNQFNYVSLFDSEKLKIQGAWVSQLMIIHHNGYDDVYGLVKRSAGGDSSYICLKEDGSFEHIQKHLSGIVFFNETLFGVNGEASVIHLMKGHYIKEDNL